MMGCGYFSRLEKGGCTTNALSSFLSTTGVELLFGRFYFFYFNKLGLALIEIIVLWGFILATIISFSKYSKVAAYLLVPYLLWVSFATVLNAAFYLLN
jgi:benzodiazapine receptor